jgi:hypothetical protein
VWKILGSAAAAELCVHGTGRYPEREIPRRRRECPEKRESESGCLEEKMARTRYPETRRDGGRRRDGEVGRKRAIQKRDARQKRCTPGEILGREEPEKRRCDPVRITDRGPSMGSRAHRSASFSPGTRISMKPVGTDFQNDFRNSQNIHLF